MSGCEEVKTEDTSSFIHLKAASEIASDSGLNKQLVNVHETENTVTLKYWHKIPNNGNVL